MSKEICYFIDTAFVGGAERYLTDLMNGMISKGYSVSVICHDFPDMVRFIKEQTKNTCRVIPCWFPSVTRSTAIQSGLSFNRSKKGVLNFLKIPGLLLTYVNILVSLIMIWKILGKMKVDIFHVNSGGYPAGEANRAAAFAAALRKIPRRVVTIHNQATVLPIKFPENLIDRKFEKTLHAITTASVDSKNALVQNRGFSPDLIAVIYYGVENPIAHDPALPHHLRKWLRIPPGEKVVGCIGGFQPRKGHVYLIEAFHQVLQKRSDVHLLLIGSGPCEKEIQQKISDLRIKTHVTMSGYQPNARRFFPAMDIFAFPSIAYECLPYVILEAMQAGTPIVATEVGGTTEEIEHGKSGLLVPPQDVTAMAQAIERLLNNENEATALRNAAEERIRSKFGMERMINETERLYL